MQKNKKMNYLPITDAWEVDLFDLVDLVLRAKETIRCAFFALTASLLFSQLKAKATKKHCSFSVWSLPFQSTEVDFFNLRSFPIATSLFLQLTNWKDSLYLKTKCTLFHYRDVIIGHMRRSGYEHATSHARWSGALKEFDVCHVVHINSYPGKLE